jgi:hypothetical protein
MGKRVCSGFLPSNEAKKQPEKYRKMMNFSLGKMNVSLRKNQIKSQNGY